MAKEADMDMSEDEKDIDAPKNKSSEDKTVQSIRSKLHQSLQTPLSARGVSFKYITSGSRDFVQGLLDDQRECLECKSERLDDGC